MRPIHVTRGPLTVGPMLMASGSGGGPKPPHEPTPIPAPKPPKKSLWQRIKDWLTKAFSL